MGCEIEEDKAIDFATRLARGETWVEDGPVLECSSKQGVSIEHACRSSCQVKLNS